MKLMIGEYEVDIKVKDARFNERNNIVDTISFLNEMSLAFYKASEMYKRDTCEALAACANKKSDDIYKTLKKMGAYKDC